MNTGTLNFFANYRPSNFNNKLSCHFNFETNNYSNIIQPVLGNDKNTITGYILPNTGDFWNKKNNSAFLSGNYIKLSNIDNSFINYKNFSFLISFEKLGPTGGVLLSNISKSTKEFIDINGNTVETEYYKGFEFGITANNYLYFEYFKNDGPEVSISDSKISDRSAIYLNCTNNTINYGYIDFNNRRLINKRFGVLSDYFFENNNIYIGYNPEANSLYSNNQKFVGYIDDIILSSPYLFDYEISNLSSGYIYDFFSSSEYIENFITTGITGSYNAITGYRTIITGWQKVATGIFTNPWGVSVMGYIDQPLIQQIPLSGIFYLSGKINNSITRYSGVSFNINNNKYLSYQKNVINFLNKIDNQDLIDVRFITGFTNSCFNKKNIVIEYDRFSDSYQNLARRDPFYNIFVNGQLQKSGRLISSNLPYQQNQIIIENDYGLNPQNNRIIFNNFYGLSRESSVFIDVNQSDNLYFNQINNSDSISFDKGRYDLFWNGQKLTEGFDYNIISKTDINSKYNLKQRLTGEENTQFATSIGMNSEGNVLIIGAPLDNEGGTEAGAAFVYTRNATAEWQLQQKLTGDSANDRFGNSVATNSDGTVLMMGGPFDDDRGTNAGGALVYTGSSTAGWRLRQKLTGDGPNAFFFIGDWFGNSVATNSDGTVLMMGGPFDFDGGTDAGAALVYTGNATAGWRLRQKLTGYQLAEFGRNKKSIATNADGTILIMGGAGAATNAGAALVYTGNATAGWRLRQSFTGGKSNYQFGTSVSMNTNGTILIIGEPGNDENGSVAGAAIIYTGNGVSGWQFKQKLTGVRLDAFGVDITNNSDASIIGIGTTAYKAYIYTGSSTNEWKLKEILTGASNDISFGSSVATNRSGDILAVASKIKLNGPNIGDVFIHTLTDTIILNENQSLSGIITAIPKNFDFNKISSGTPILNLNNNFYYNNTEVYVNGVRQTLNYDYLELSQYDVSSGIKIVLENNKDYIYNNEGFIK